MLNYWAHAWYLFETLEKSTSSRMVEFWYRKRFLHYSEVFVEIAFSCAIVLCFGQFYFSSFSIHLEQIYKNCFKSISRTKGAPPGNCNVSVHKSEIQAQMSLESATFDRGYMLKFERCIINGAGFVLITDVPNKITSLHNFLAIFIQIRFHKTFWKVPRQTKAYMSNK
ncbi:hypothetical protein T07_5448 [Trichinella nelsoni]|uniref:Uncharacterized protein n=1 Tax=Trichinella nelsoni TaxID=6336 RepID=A0A0V0SBY9_9BILA|nr:hypothetical protein T07_5448 [Trichinella nelsoni]